MLILRAICLLLVVLSLHAQTQSNTPTRSGTGTRTGTPSNTPSRTSTPSQTRTRTGTPTNTKSRTPTPSKTRTQTPSKTGTPSKTPSWTPTKTRTPSRTPTPSITASRTGTPTQTRTPTGTRTQTPSRTPGAVKPSGMVAIQNRDPPGVRLEWDAVDYDTLKQVILRILPYNPPITYSNVATLTPPRITADYQLGSTAATCSGIYGPQRYALVQDGIRLTAHHSCSAVAAAVPQQYCNSFGPTANANVFSRGNGPAAFFNVNVTGSWSASVTVTMLDNAAPQGLPGNAIPVANPDVYFGVAEAWRNVPASQTENIHAITHRIDVANSQVLCTTFGNVRPQTGSADCSSPFQPFSGDLSIQLRIDYEVSADSYTFFYRLSDANNWVQYASRSSDNSIFQLHNIRNPRIFFAVRFSDITTPLCNSNFANHGASANFTNFAFVANTGSTVLHRDIYDAYDRRQRYYIPLERYSMYSIAVKTVNYDNITSPEANVSSLPIVVGPSGVGDFMDVWIDGTIWNPTATAGGGRHFFVDFSTEWYSRRALRTQDLSRAAEILNEFKTHPNVMLAPSTWANRPFMVRNARFDRASLQCQRESSQYMIQASSVGGAPYTTTTNGAGRNYQALPVIRSDSVTPTNDFTIALVFSPNVVDFQSSQVVFWPIFAVAGTTPPGATFGSGVQNFPSQYLERGHSLGVDGTGRLLWRWASAEVTSNMNNMPSWPSSSNPIAAINSKIILSPRYTYVVILQGTYSSGGANSRIRLSMRINGQTNQSILAQTSLRTFVSGQNGLQNWRAPDALAPSGSSCNTATSSGCFWSSLFAFNNGNLPVLTFCKNAYVSTQGNNERRPSYNSMHLYEMTVVQRSFTTVVSAFESYLYRKYYLVCPPLRSEYVSTHGMRALTGAPAINTCVGTVSTGSCVMRCNAGLIPVSGVLTGASVPGNGNITNVCRDGSWALGVPVCGRKCPNLARPASANTCQQILQWEPFVIGHFIDEINMQPQTMFAPFWNVQQQPTENVIVKRFSAAPTGTGDMSAVPLPSSLYRYMIFPAPGVVLYDVFNIPEDVQAAMRPVASASEGMNNETYDAYNVWLRGDTALQLDISNNSNLLYGSNLHLPGTSPLGGHILFIPNPAWLTDGTSTQTGLTFSMRVRPIAGRAGMAYAIRSTSTDDSSFMPSNTRYYYVYIDAEVMDPDSMRGAGTGLVLNLVRVVDGVSTSLATRSWNALNALNIPMLRGRWYTITVMMDSAIGQRVSIQDDFTGVSAPLFTISDFVIFPGTVGPWLNGEAMFDDVRVVGSCTSAGFCNLGYSSITANGGGMCMHTCPPGYTTGGNPIRHCNADGTWSGRELLCFPPPPTWVYSNNTNNPEGRPVQLDGKAYFFREVIEKAPKNTPVGLPIVAAAPPDSDLQVQYLIDNTQPGNADDILSIVFAIDSCSGTIKISSQAGGMVDYYRQRQYNITVMAYVEGDAGSTANVSGVVVINILDVNDPPLITAMEIFVNESSLTGGYVLTEDGGPITALDPEGTPAKFRIVAGNERGLFAIGQQPYLSTNVSNGLMTLAPGVNEGRYPSTLWCSCGSRGINFEDPNSNSFMLIVQAIDGLNDTLFTQARVTVTVLDNNDAPAFAQPTVTVDISESLTANLVDPLFIYYVSAVDEDNDPIFFSVASATGKMGLSQTDVAMVTAGNAPALPAQDLFFIDETGDLFLMKQLITGAPSINVNGVLLKGMVAITVQAFDDKNATGNMTVLLRILSNETIPTEVPVIEEMTIPTGTLLTDGSSIILIKGPYLNITNVFARYTRTFNGSVVQSFDSTCLYMPHVSTPPLITFMNCSTQEGIGVGFTWAFWRRITMPNSNSTYIEPIIVAPLADLTASYGEPVISSIALLEGASVLSLLPTLGGAVIRLNGRNFGPPSLDRFRNMSASMSATTAGGTLTLSLEIRNFTHTTMDVVVPAGVGSNYVISLTVLGRAAVAAQTVSFREPSITAVIPSTGVELQRLTGAGGEIISVIGNDFGPGTITLNGNVVPYTPIIAYGPGTLTSIFPLSDCIRECSSNTSPLCHSQITCRTSPGIGSQLRVSMRSRFAQDFNAPALSSQTLAYRGPIIQRILGGRSMGTPGGDRIVVIGQNLGTPSLFSSGLMSIAVNYGPYGFWSKYSGVACEVLQLAGYEQPSIACESAEGSGTGFEIAVNVQLVQNLPANWSNPFRDSGFSPLGYAAPTLSAFQGNFLSKLAVGGDEITIIGNNFGNNMSDITVTYILTLNRPANVLPSFNGTQMDQVIYRPSSCVMTSPHETLMCVITPGSGANIQWKVIVNGQESRSPTTSYEVPEIKRIELLAPVTLVPIPSASTDGGDILLVWGSGFGPAQPTAFGGVPLIQSAILASGFGMEVDLVSRTGRKLWTHVNDSLINVTLPGGTGFNWRVVLQIADREIDSGAYVFDYSSPSVVSVQPQLGPGAGGNTVIVHGRNLGLNDELNLIAVILGNPLDASLYPSAIVASRVSFHLDRVSFMVPPGHGAGRAIRLVSFRSGTPIPNPFAVVAGPRDTACNGTFITGTNYLPASSCTGIDMYNYMAPQISFIFVTAPTSAESEAAQRKFGLPPNGLRVLQIFGSNFGEGLERYSSLLGTLRLIEDCYEKPCQPSTSFKFDGDMWKPDYIVAYTALREGNIRIGVISRDWSGQPIAQYSNSRAFADYTPVARLAQNPGSIPTVGNVIVNITVQYLQQAVNGFSLFLSNRQCLIVNPNDPSRCRAGDTSGCLTTLLETRENVVDNPNIRVPPGFALTDDTIWILQCLAPVGYGRVAPLVLRRAGEGDSSPVTLSYAPPSIARVWIGLRASRPTTIPDFDPAARYIAETDGTSFLVLTGANFGPCPHLKIATHLICIMNQAICPDLACPSNGVLYTLTTGEPDRLARTAKLSSGHDRLELYVPGGEGDGLEFLADGIGWTIILTAGDQSQTTGVIKMGYAPPTITSVAQINNGGFPTMGNVSIAIIGRNFGMELPSLVYSAAVFPQVFLQSSAPNCAQPCWSTCTSVVRIDTTRLECLLPAGTGRGLSALVRIFGQSFTLPSALNYDPPMISNITVLTDVNSTAANVAGNIAYRPTRPNIPTTLYVPTHGTVFVRVQGNNFGTRELGQTCIFLAWRYREKDMPLTCDGIFNYHGEGEIAARKIRSWSHRSIVFEIPPGAGQPEFLLYVQGQYQVPTEISQTPDLQLGGYGTPPYIRYLAPTIKGRLTPDSGPTDFSVKVLLNGTNLAVGHNTISQLGRPFNYPFVLSEFTVPPPTYAIRINWGPQPFSHNPTKYNWAPPKRTGPCICSALAPVGSNNVRAYPGCDQCRNQIIEHSHEQIAFMSHPGVGANVSLSISVIDGDDVETTPSLLVFDYDAPVITAFQPQPIVVGAMFSSLLRVTGINFGTIAVMEAFLPDYRADDNYTIYNQAQLIISDNPEWCQKSVRTKIFATEVVECQLQGELISVGSHNTSIYIAGQQGRMSWRDPAALQVVCAPRYFGRVGESCITCPQFGAECSGYVVVSPRLPVTDSTPSWADVVTVYDSVERDFVDQIAGFHTYPRPLPFFYNLNETMAEACPEMIRAKYPKRDVCIVKCEPDEACLGDNVCAPQYVSKAPMYRCSSCAPKHFRQNGLCVPCPDNPWAIFIGFGMIVIFAASAGYLLNKRGVNIAILSIGIDFFQVIAIIGNSRIKWPPAVQELFRLMSAFNLNIEIVSPECLVPDVSYKQKFQAIFVLPLAVVMLFVLLCFVQLVYQGCCKCQSFKKAIHDSLITLVSAVLALMYFMYIYLTRTLLDIFNCTPTVPPDGKLYLQVVFEECGIPGGTQLTLLPFAMTGFVTYTAGYPIAIALTLYRNRELVIEDQLLRAMHTGDTKLTNPRALTLRRMMSRAYYQYLPDYAYYWSSFIILRKFCIAATSILFNKNASFQMAACLLVMFLAYSIQLRFTPFMGPTDGKLAIAAHEKQLTTSAIHARVEQRIQEVKYRGRKSGSRNSLVIVRQVSRYDALKTLTSWIFNYNTVEGFMLFASIVVCLMGVMYLSQKSDYGEDDQARDSITFVLIFTVLAAIIYFVVVVVTELVVLYNESALTKALQKKLSSVRGKNKPKKVDAIFTKAAPLYAEPANDETAKIQRVNPMLLDQTQRALFLQEEAKQQNADFMRFMERRVESPLLAKDRKPFKPSPVVVDTGSKETAVPGTAETKEGTPATAGSGSGSGSGSGTGRSSSRRSRGDREKDHGAAPAANPNRSQVLSLSQFASKGVSRSTSKTKAK